MGKINITLVCCFVSVCACSPSKLTPAKYSKWVKDMDHGLFLTRINGDYKLSLQFRPIDYVVSNEIVNSRKTFSEFNKIKKELSGMYYFTFRIESADKGTRVLDIGNTSEADINSKLDYFSFNMQNDLKLVSGNDTLSCGLYNFERNYELAPYLDFSLAFPCDIKDGNHERDLQFIYDGEALGIGIIKFGYDKKLLNSIPQLSTAE